jgi:hypothetical protein
LPAPRSRTRPRQHRPPLLAESLALHRRTRCDDLPVYGLPVFTAQGRPCVVPVCAARLRCPSALPVCAARLRRTSTPVGAQRQRSPSARARWVAVTLAIGRQDQRPHTASP